MNASYGIAFAGAKRFPGPTHSSFHLMTNYWQQLIECVVTMPPPLKPDRILKKGSETEVGAVVSLSGHSFTSALETAFVQ